jgi:hypothetical protein
LALQEILKLYHNMVILIESLESTEPIFKNQERLFVRINTSEQLLHQWHSEIKSPQGLIFSHKRREALK